MYWTDWGLKTIEQATMAGEKRHALMDSKTVQGPTGLSLDLQERKLYWADKVKDLVSLKRRGVCSCASKLFVYRLVNMI